MNCEFDILYNELVVIVDELRPYYDIDKIKPFSVYIWTKEGGQIESQNVFDIIEDNIIFYVDHIIPDEVNPIIAKIQSKLKQLELCGRIYNEPKTRKIYLESHDNYEVNTTKMKVYKLIELNREILLVVQSPTMALYTVHGTKLILFTQKRQSLAKDVEIDYVSIDKDIVIYNSASKFIKLCR